MKSGHVPRYGDDAKKIDLRREQDRYLTHTLIEQPSQIKAK